MSKVFISYRHTEPDSVLAQSIAEALTVSRHAVFVDTQIMLGARWVEVIDREIRAADFFVVLLSGNSILSDMVRQEIKLAYELSQSRRPPLVILPVRVAFTGELPYDLGAYLEPIQYALWQAGEPFESVIEQILGAIDRAVRLPGKGHALADEASAAALAGLSQATDAIGAPLPVCDPRLVMDTGAVRPESPFYIRRQADDQAESVIQRDGATLVVKGPRQVGKSSLLASVHAQARKQKLKSFYLDFQLIDRCQLESLETLFLYLARKIARAFKAAERPDEFWDDYMGPTDNLTDYVGAAILEEADSPVLLLFDEADRVFEFSEYRDEFFATMRGWHNLRATDDRWCHFNLVIAHSTEPSLWIQDIHQSPFNVGERIYLADFSLDQLVELNHRHGRVLNNDSELLALLELVGGQPYLTRQAFYALAVNSLSFSELQRLATDNDGPFGDHLRRFLWILQEQPELRDAMKRVLRDNSCDDEAVFQRLLAAGLVKGEHRGAVEPRCRLYRDYFRKCL